MTGIYILVTVVAVAAQPAADFKGQEAGLSAILEDVTGNSWPATVLAAGAVISIFSVTLVVIYGQTRILFAMGRDGMIPPLFHKLNPRTLTPVPSTIIVAVVISLLAGVLPIDFLAEMTSIGTLVAFLVVSIGVMVLRQKQPDLPRGFKVPLYPLVPIASIGGCIWIIQDLRAVTIYVFLLWSSVALLWYFFYGRHHSAPEPPGAAGRHAMSLLVAFAPDGRGRAVLHLAAMLARSAEDDLVVCAVVPAPWYPSPARVDAEYRSTCSRRRESALDEARARLPADIPATFVVHDARSAPAGLLEVAEEHDASLIVVGSSSAGGVGHVTLGSASSRLLHSSPLPVAVAPRGFRCPPDARVARVTAAFGGSEGAENLVIAAAGRRGRGRRRPAARLLRGAGATALHERRRHRGRRSHGRGVDPGDRGGRRGRRSRRSSDLPAVPRELEIVVGRGESWEEALEDVEWEEGDVLVVGSSSIGPVARVFLGSRATKIVQHSPVPVVVVPRGAAAELADEALHAESV